MSEVYNPYGKSPGKTFAVPDTYKRPAARTYGTGTAPWQRLRKQVLMRDLYACRGYPFGVHHPNCSGYATDVDHIDDDASNNTLDNLQSLSRACHSSKTAQTTGPNKYRKP